MKLDLFGAITFSGNVGLGSYLAMTGDHALAAVLFAVAALMAFIQWG